MTSATEPHLESFTITTEVFSGPMDLLIDLVEKRKLLINDIALAEVTDEYMRHVSEMQRLSLPDTANFVALASTLLLIKSKSLLPVLELTTEEEQSIEDLEERLRLYQIYRRAGKIVQDVFGGAIMHERNFVPPTEPLFVTDEYTKLDALEGAMRNVLHNLPKKELKRQAQVRKVISLEEMMDRLQSRIERQLKTSFKELTADAKERTDFIVGFLAILEIVKQGDADAHQHEHFADIEVGKEGNTAPRYE